MPAPVNAAPGADRSPPRRAAAIACGSLIVFAAVHVYWGLGFRPGLTTFLAYEGKREAEVISSLRFKVFGLWAVALLSMAGAAVAGTVVRGQERTAIPPRMVVILAAGAAGVLGVRGGYGLIFSPLRLLGLVATPADVDPDWFWLDALLLAPGFAIVGACFAVIAWDTWRRIRCESSSQHR